jgi:hypothetical protein
MTQLVIRLAYAAAGLLAGLLIMVNHQQVPPCPTEDSCRAEYSDSSWHIRPDTP